MSSDVEVFRHQVDVRWGDMDALGHVNNTLYFRYMEEARIRWMQCIGYQFSVDDMGPVIANTSLDFKRPVVFPAELEIILSAQPPGNSSVNTLYTFENAGNIVATGAAVIVWVNYKQGKAVSLPDLVRNALLVG
jgi:acyl-CoA thioester hydrolase